ncbi:hypothetical protein E0H77_12500 [Acinetobacter sp. ANC 4633]|nr:hypothetical protein E0H77_12500 [Acinetobacter sp. ANC 4633]
MALVVPVSGTTYLSSEAAFARITAPSTVSTTQTTVLNIAPSCVTIDVLFDNQSSFAQTLQLVSNTQYTGATGTLNAGVWTTNITVPANSQLTLLLKQDGTYLTSINVDITNLQNQLNTTVTTYPGGTIVQYGDGYMEIFGYVVSVTSSELAVNFPVAFTTCYGVLATCYSNGSASPVAIGTTLPTNTGFTAYAGSQTVGFQYFAKGRWK